MAQRITYHPGGYIAAAPQKNRAELYDGVANTYTQWDVAGSVLATRALTVAEKAELDAVQASDIVFANRENVRGKIQAAIATNIAALALPNPTAANTTYINSAALPAGAALTTTQLTTIVRALDAQLRAISNQNNALVAQVRALTNQNTALERFIGDQLDSTAGT